MSTLLPLSAYIETRFKPFEIVICPTTMLLVHLTLLLIPARFRFFSCADRYFFLFFLFLPDVNNTWSGWLCLLEWILVISSSSTVIVLFLPSMLSFWS